MIFTASRVSNENLLKKLVFHRDPGFDNPQYGQAGSSELISLRQFGQSIEFFSLVVMLRT